MIRNILIRRYFFMKRLKSMVAIALCMAVLFSFGFATTWLTYDTWSVSHTNTPGTPSYAGATTDQCNMVYSTYGIQLNLLSISNTIGGAYGSVTVSCTNWPMTNITLNNSNISAVAKPQVSGAVPGVSLLFTPYTSYPHNHYSASGEAYSRTTP